MLSFSPYTHRYFLGHLGTLLAACLLWRGIEDVPLVSALLGVYPSLYANHVTWGLSRVVPSGWRTKMHSLCLTSTCLLLVFVASQGYRVLYCLPALPTPLGAPGRGASHTPIPTHPVQGVGPLSLCAVALSLLVSGVGLGLGMWQDGVQKRQSPPLGTPASEAKGEGAQTQTSEVTSSDIFRKLSLAPYRPSVYGQYFDHFGIVSSIGLAVACAYTLCPGLLLGGGAETDMTLLGMASTGMATDDSVTRLILLTLLGGMYLVLDVCVLHLVDFEGCALTKGQGTVSRGRGGRERGTTDRLADRARVVVCQYMRHRSMLVDPSPDCGPAPATLASLVTQAHTLLTDMLDCPGTSPFLLHVTAHLESVGMGKEDQRREREKLERERHEARLRERERDSDGELDSDEAEWEESEEGQGLTSWGEPRGGAPSPTPAVPTDTALAYLDEAAVATVEWIHSHLEGVMPHEQRLDVHLTAESLGLLSNHSGALLLRGVCLSLLPLCRHLHSVWHISWPLSTVRRHVLASVSRSFLPTPLHQGPDEVFGSVSSGVSSDMLYGDRDGDGQRTFRYDADEIAHILTELQRFPSHGRFRAKYAELKEALLSKTLYNIRTRVDVTLDSQMESASTAAAKRPPSRLVLDLERRAQTEATPKADPPKGVVPFFRSAVTLARDEAELWLFDYYLPAHSQFTYTNAKWTYWPYRGVFKLSQRWFRIFDIPEPKVPVPPNASGTGTDTQTEGEGEAEASLGMSDGGFASFLSRIKWVDLLDLREAVYAFLRGEKPNFHVLFRYRVKVPDQEESESGGEAEGRERESSRADREASGEGDGDGERPSYGEGEGDTDTPRVGEKWVLALAFGYAAARTSQDLPSVVIGSFSFVVQDMDEALHSRINQLHRSSVSSGGERGGERGGRRQSLPAHTLTGMGARLTDEATSKKTRPSRRSETGAMGGATKVDPQPSHPHPHHTNHACSAALSALSPFDPTRTVSPTPVSLTCMDDWTSLHKTYRPTLPDDGQFVFPTDFYAPESHVDALLVRRAALLADPTTHAILDQALVSEDQRSFDATAFEDSCGGFGLCHLLLHMFHKEGWVRHNVTERQIAEYSLTIYPLYRAVPYHSCLHALDVIQFAYHLANKIRHDKSVGRCVVPSLSHLLLCLAMSAHDADHAGLSNEFVSSTNQC
ncbi:hypothetical protein KIPB_002561, partial [Kipferlia bialata]|eukprot:g2561.t1